MKVCVEGFAFEQIGTIGIWRVFYEVLSRISKDVEVLLWLRSPPMRPLPAGVRLVVDTARYWNCGRYNIIGRAKRVLSRRRIPSELRNVDLYHPTYLTPRPALDVPEMVTVYDMIQERFFGICGDWAVGHIALKRVQIRESKRCLAISQATADDVVRFYPDAAERVRLTLLGAEHLGEGSANKGITTAEPYLLFVGARNGHKNFATLLEAMNEPAWPCSLPLWVVGQPPADYETALVNYHRLGDRIRFVGFVPDDQLRGLYQSASGFIFPSICEGFGLPVLEAQVNRAPVLASDIPAFREVGCEASCIYFDPRSARSISVAVTELMEGKRRQAMIEAGLENVRRFRWADTAAATLKAYQEAVNATAAQA